MLAMIGVILVAEKITVVFVLCLSLLVCSLPAYAAAELPDWKGNFYTEFYYNPDIYLRAGSRLLLYNEMKVGKDGETIISLGGWLPSYFELDPGCLAATLIKNML